VIYWGSPSNIVLSKIDLRPGFSWRLTYKCWGWHIHFFHKSNGTWYWQHNPDILSYARPLTIPPEPVRREEFKNWIKDKLYIQLITPTKNNELIEVLETMLVEAED